MMCGRLFQEQTIMDFVVLGKCQTFSDVLESVQFFLGIVMLLLLTFTQEQVSAVERLCHDIQFCG